MDAAWKHAIIVGASSGIGAEVARQLAARGCRVALVARRGGELERIAAEINAGAPGRASTYVHDVTAYAEAPQLLDRICGEIGGLDLVVYAAGVMPRIEDGEYSFAKDRAIVDVNVLGAIAW